MSQGWICLHRQLLEWEWYSDINTTRLFLHCLLKANHKEKKWQGKTIPRGSFITGRSVLSDETGLTQQQIRTSLNKLKSTSDITIKATNKFSLVTVVNYGLYQDKDIEVTNKITCKPLNGQPTNNQQITTTNNDNNDNNINNMSSTKVDNVPFSQICDLYNQILSMLPAVVEKSENRRKVLKARWNENKDRQSLDWWTRYFSYIESSDFLTGRVDPDSSGKIFLPNFDWIIKPANMTKIIEGNYHR